MELNRDLIIEIYKSLLNREPENEKVIIQHLSTHSTLEEFIHSITNSIEFRTKFIKKYLPKKILFFIHIEKTAGTFIREKLLKNSFERVCYFDNNIEQKKHFISRMKNYTEALSYQAFTGHLFLSEFLEIDVIQPRIITTILRDPIKRVISYYNFLKHKAPGHPLEPIVKEHTLYELLIGRNTPFYTAVDNWQLRYLHLNQNSFYKLSDRDKIIIGKQEFIDDFIETVNMEMNIKTDSTISSIKLNAADKNYDIKVKEEENFDLAEQILQELTLKEYELYNHLDKIEVFTKDEYLKLIQKFF